MTAVPPAPKHRRDGGSASGRDPASGGPAEPAADDRDPQERPGLARERTTLAWTRTAIAFAALGGVVLKENVITGLIILGIAPLVWQLGRLPRGDSPSGLAVVGTTRIRLITVSIVAVALLALLVAVFGHSVPGALR